MGRLDKWLFSTYEKRVSFSILIIAILHFVDTINDFLLGHSLYSCSTVTDLIGLLDNDAIYNTVLGRSVVNYLDGYSWYKIIYYSLGLMGIIAIFYLSVFIFTKQPKTIKKLKLLTIIDIMLLLAEYCLVILYIYFAYTSLTTDNGVLFMNYSGNVLRIGSIIQILYLLCATFYIVFSSFKATE